MFCQHLSLQLAVNPEFKVGEMSFDNNAAVCELIYSETTAWVGNCSLARPWCYLKRSTSDRDHFFPIITASSGLWDSQCMRQYLLLMLLVPWGICDGGHGSVVESIYSLFSFPHWRNQVNCTANPLDSVPLLQSVCLSSRKRVLLNLKSYGYLCYFFSLIHFGYSHWISIVISSPSVIS